MIEVNLIIFFESKITNYDFELLVFSIWAVLIFYRYFEILLILVLQR